jgi:solute carrier family 35, member E3
MFQPKPIAWREVLDLAAAYVAYIVLGNVSIKMNPVGFYQVTKALIAPTILAINSFKSGVMPRGEVMASVVLLTTGILAATVTDAQVMSNFQGILVGIAYVFSTALYNILAGQRQKSLHAGVFRLHENSSLSSKYATHSCAT